MQVNNNYQKMAIKEPGNIWFCADLHGQYDLLMRELSAVGFSPKKGHILVSSGDLIDSGPDSAKVISLLQEPWFKAAEGNHENMMLNCLKDLTEKTFEHVMNMLHSKGLHKTVERYRNGQAYVSEIRDFTDHFGEDYSRWLLKGSGEWFFSRRADYGTQRIILDTLRHASLPRIIEIQTDGGNIGVLHAQPVSEQWDDSVSGEGTGVAHMLQWARTDVQSFLKQRSPQVEEHLSAWISGIDGVVMGHTIVPDRKPMIRGNRVYLDVGARSGVAPLLMNGADVLAKISENKRLIQARLGISAS